MKKINLIRFVFAFMSIVFLQMSNGYAQKSSALTKAAQAAVNGKELQKIKVLNHEFNIYGADVEEIKGKTVVSGIIDHHLSFRPDDIITYSFTKKGDEVSGMKMSIDRGGMAKLYAPAVAGAAAAVGKKVSVDQIRDIGGGLGKITDGKWEDACFAIICRIAELVD